MPLYEYQCTDCDVVTEKIVPMAAREEAQTCPSCGATARYKVSAVRCKLDGLDPGFPGAYDKWSRQHEKAGRKTPEQPSFILSLNRKAGNERYQINRHRAV